MKKLTLIILFWMLAPFVLGATWVNNPTTCPNNYQSQTCSGSNLVCGYNGGVTFCYDMTTINPPSSNATSNTDQDSGSYNGGYIMDCVSYDGTSPFCDNGGNEYCDRNSTCYTTNQRDTICLANNWAKSACGNCRSGYLNCTGYPCSIQTGVTQNNSNSVYTSCSTFACVAGYLDCDGSGDGNNPTGCEIQNGGACTIGGLVGVYSGCNGAVGNCVVSTSHFITGVQANYSTSSGQHFLWGWDYGVGNLLFLRNNATNSNFSINATGCLRFNDGTTQCTASTGSSSGGPSWGLTPPYLYNASGNITLNTTATDLLYKTNVAMKNESNTFTGNITVPRINVTVSFYPNVTRWPNGACEYSNATAVLFRNPCDV
jgi:hypothetical protein